MMELTPERKQQIEDEEQRRLAEEDYRQQVRSRLAPSASQTWPPPSKRSGPETHKSRVGVLVGFLAIMAVVGLVMVISNQHVASATAPYAPSIRTVPVVQNIASGQSLITANGFAFYRFQVTPAMRSAHVTGKFSAFGGSGNDIAAILATEEEATNWINGHQAKAFYTTPGRETTGTFDVHLGPGSYSFAISNRFSAFSSKSVFLQVDLNYSRMETY